MDKLALVLMLAVTAEALVEYGKSLAAAFGGGDYKAAVLQLCAAVVSVLLCVLGVVLFSRIEKTFMDTV